MSLSVGKAAAELGLSPDTIRSYIKAGHLDGWRLPTGRWRVEPESVADLKRRARMEGDELRREAASILAAATEKNPKRRASLRIATAAGRG